jgi:hypothetical protein
MYVLNSRRKRLVLDEREFIYEREVDLTHTVTEYWRRLCASADHNVMHEMRQSDPARKDHWKTIWDIKTEKTRSSPGIVVTIVSLKEQY